MEITQRYLRELEFNERSDKTIMAYMSDIAKLVEYIEEKIGNKGTLDEYLCLVDFDLLEDFKYSLVEKGYARASINRYLMGIRSFFNYYSKRGVENPAANVKGYRKVNSKKKRMLTREEVESLLNQTQRKNANERFVDFNGARDRFLIALLATTGLRIEEALTITFNDMDIFDDYIMVNITIHGEDTTKLNKRIPICGKTLNYYRDYMMEYEKKYDAVGDNYLIVSPRSGKKIVGKDSNKAIKKYAVEIGIEDISNHCFRSFTNVWLMAVGAPDSIRNKIMGWADNEMGSTVYFSQTEEIDKIMVKHCEKILL